MAAPTTTAMDLNDGIIEAGVFESRLMTAAGADTFLDNTLVAHDTSTLKIVPYVKGGSTNGNGVVYGLLTKGFVAAGAGDTPVRIMKGGKVLTDKTVIDADGTSTNIDNAVKFLCADKGLHLVDSTSLHVADNT